MRQQSGEYVECWSVLKSRAQQNEMMKKVFKIKKEKGTKKQNKKHTQNNRKKHTKNETNQESRDTYIQIDNRKKPKNIVE